MTRDKARSLLAKLQALADPARGGTPGERAAAQRKADDLIARFDLRRPEPPPIRPTRVFTGGRDGQMPTAWFTDEKGTPAEGVKVHHFQDRRNWRIEFEPEAPRPGFKG